VASCFAQGTSSGLILDSGEHLTSLARVIDGYQETTTCFNFGGSMLSA
jgi:actin-related protein